MVDVNTEFRYQEMICLIILLGCLIKVGQHADTTARGGQMKPEEAWKNFNLGQEVSISGAFIYNGLRRFHEMRILDHTDEIFEVLYTQNRPAFCLILTSPICSFMASSKFSP